MRLIAAVARRTTARLAARRRCHDRAAPPVGGQSVALRTEYPYETDSGWVTTSTVYYLHRDYLGNLTEITDAEGVVEGRARYDAFGRLLENTIPATITTRLYTGSIYASATLSAGDPATRLYKIGARWYDPGIGVWLTPDSLVPDVNNPIAWNGYAFNYNNPVNFSDPSGHFPWLLAAGVFALGGFGGHLAATSAGYDIGSTQWVASVGLGGAFAVGGFGLGYAGYGGWALAAGIAGDTAIDTAILGGPFWSSLARNAVVNIGFNVAGYAIGRAFQRLRLRKSGYGIGGGLGWDDEAVWRSWPDSVYEGLGDMPPESAKAWQAAVEQVNSGDVYVVGGYAKGYHQHGGKDFDVFIMDTKAWQDVWQELLHGPPVPGGYVDPRPGFFWQVTRGTLDSL